MDVIDSPAAWHAAELVASESWRRVLTPAEITALEQATAGARDRGVPAFGFSASAMPLPDLSPLFTWMAEQLERGPGVVRLSGLPVGRIALDDLRRMFWGFCANLGTPVYQTAAGEILGEVKDETGTGQALTYDSNGAGPLLSARTVARSTGALRFHTDKTDLLCLLCASNGIAGGESRMVSSVAIHNEMARRRPDLLELMYQPFWRMRPQDEEGQREDPVFPMAIFARGPDGSFTSQYSRTYINQAQELPGVPRLTPQQNEALDLLHQISDEIGLTAPFEAGDMQFMNQHVTYHGRTAFTDDATAGAHRRLLRIWLSAPFTRPLPETHAVQWGAIAPGAVRGGAIPRRPAVTWQA